MTTVYVRAASKAAINRTLALGGVSGVVYGTVYDWGNGDTVRLDDMSDGTVVKVFQKYVMGSPYAKAYGTIRRDKAGKVRVV